MKSSNSWGHKVAKEIVEVIRVSKGKKIKWRCKLKNKLIFFTYYLKLLFLL